MHGTKLIAIIKTYSKFLHLHFVHCLAGHRTHCTFGRQGTKSSRQRKPARTINCKVAIGGHKNRACDTLMERTMWNTFGTNENILQTTLYSVCNAKCSKAFKTLTIQDESAIMNN